MDYKKTNASRTTVTLEKSDLDKKTGNLYETLAILSKRAVQINNDLKTELIQKLEEFATHSDSLEEIFENNEQIEVSRFYESLPKPALIAVEEWMNDQIYFRKPKSKKSYEEEEGK